MIHHLKMLMCSSANTTVLGISDCFFFCVWISFLPLIPETDLKCSSLHQKKRSPWNVKEDINRWSLEDERLNERWKVKKSGGVKSIEKIENDRKDLSFSWPSGKIKNNPASERR